MTNETCPEAPADRGAKCILKVDDDQDMLDILDAFIESAGYRAIEARGGREAIEKARTFLPDLILLDILMPEVNGYVVMETLKADARTAGIPIVVVSARPAREHREKSLRLGAVEYVPKPFTEEHILAVVRSVIGEPGAARDPAN